MWSKWSLRAKIMTVAMGVVLPIMAATTALTVRLSRQALEDDIRTNGLTLARELATSVASRRAPAGGRFSSMRSEASWVGAAWSETSQCMP